MPAQEVGSGGGTPVVAEKEEEEEAPEEEVAAAERFAAQESIHSFAGKRQEHEPHAQNLGTAFRLFSLFSPSVSCVSFSAFSASPAYPFRSACYLRRRPSTRHPSRIPPRACKGTKSADLRINDRISIVWHTADI